MKDPLTSPLTSDVLCSENDKRGHEVGLFRVVREQVVQEALAVGHTSFSEGAVNAGELSEAKSNDAINAIRKDGVACFRRVDERLLRDVDAAKPTQLSFNAQADNLKSECIPCKLDGSV